MPRGSPPSAHQLSTLPCILLRRRGLARAQSSPRTVLGVGGVDIILETKSRLSQEVRGERTMAIAWEHRLRVLQSYLRASHPCGPVCGTTLVLQRRTQDQAIYLLTSNEAGL